MTIHVPNNFPNCSDAEDAQKTGIELKGADFEPSEWISKEKENETEEMFDDEDEVEILRLTRFWYEYVSLDHHKDCDCHWYINRVWSYGQKPVWRVEHHGYSTSPVDIECDSYEEAVGALIDALGVAIRREQQWARQVIAEPSRWDEGQMACAKKVLAFDL